MYNKTLAYNQRVNQYRYDLLQTLRYLYLLKTNVLEVILKATIVNSYLYMISDYMYTNVRLEHVIMLLLGTEGLLEDSNMSLVVLMLLLQSLHLGTHG